MFLWDYRLDSTIDGSEKAVSVMARRIWLCVSSRPHCRGWLQNSETMNSSRYSSSVIRTKNGRLDNFIHYHQQSYPWEISKYCRHLIWVDSWPFPREIFLHQNSFRVRGTWIILVSSCHYNYWLRKEGLWIVLMQNDWHCTIELSIETLLAVYKILSLIFEECTVLFSRDMNSNCNRFAIKFS